MSNKAGIIDPWETPKAPKAGPTVPVKNRINLDQVDLDADLRVNQSYVFRGKDSSIQVTNTLIGTSQDALRDLVGALLKLSSDPVWGTVMCAEGVGCQLEGASHNPPSSTIAACEMKTAEGYTPAAVLWFIGQTYDRGMLRLTKILRDVRRSPQNEILQEFGIIPMLK